MRFLMHNLLFVTFLLVCTGVIAQESEYGLASYYGDEFHGSETASGERYDKDALTAAHKTLPMGTRVRVTRMDNKKSDGRVISSKCPTVYLDAFWSMGLRDGNMQSADGMS